LSWQNLREEFGIAFKQSVDRLGHLTRYPTDDPLLPHEGLRLLVIRAPSLDQALVQFGPLIGLQADSLEDSKEQDLLHRPGSSACQTGMIQGAAGLDDNWSPTEVRFEGRCRGEVVDRANGRNDRRRSDGPETWKRQQDLPVNYKIVCRNFLTIVCRIRVKNDCFSGWRDGDLKGGVLLLMSQMNVMSPSPL
jgi:hypothetical protein